ncbi:hypothetical protein F5148DRAFT_1288590 [Russula earlei]|uniref:Uncharacterized protein n=1 Tax=Russula earlei TaxID=71964 RepID=A0ACC0U1N3_9AGAM|nr:hypothetical protein F5148DRAFT_1288590 [Russula earlei]
MSRTASAATESLAPAAQAIALLLASTRTVLSDALVYAEHAGRPIKVEMDDVTLAVQARVGWEFGGRVPKENGSTPSPWPRRPTRSPSPAVPEVFGLRLPSANECLTAIDFDLVPNRPSIHACRETRPTKSPYSH